MRFDVLSQSIGSTVAARAHCWKQQTILAVIRRVMVALDLRLGDDDFG